MKLVFSDEFDYSGLPDPQKWDYEEGRVRNHEDQFYTRGRLENARVEDGNLVITARHEPYQGAEYTSASLITHGHFDFTYGRVEVRAKIPGGVGTWPAIWLLGSNIRRVGWPRCGEIDMMENVGFEPFVVHFTIHTQARNWVNGKAKGSQRVVQDLADDYHLYTLDWDAHKLVLGLDGQPALEYPKEDESVASWPFDFNMYLLLNLAIGGTWGGQHGIDLDIFPAEFKIDYVRIYRP